MFGFLKNKIKEWVGKAKDKIVTQEEDTSKKLVGVLDKEEIKVKTKKTKVKREKGSKNKIIEEQPKLKLEESGTAIKIEEEIEEGISEKDIEALEKTIEESKTQEVQEVPQEFNAGTLKYEPNLEEIKKEEKKGFFARLKEKFVYKIDESEFNDIFEDLEMSLLENNVALEAVENIRDNLKQKLIGKEIKKDKLESEIKEELKKSLNETIVDPQDPLMAIKSKKHKNEPFVILFFGINGTGKTTTIAKLTNLLQKNKLSVVLAAADTFRAASIEQIAIHADKLKVPLIRHDYGSDPSAVGFDAIKYAKAHKIDVVLIDTAGRMHTKENLLKEMEKICRVTNPDLKIFVAESIAGNDATEQAKSFNDMIKIDGSILTKADVDEKGGTIISISSITHKPIFYLGTGQEYKDIELFNKEKFIERLGL